MGTSFFLVRSIPLQPLSVQHRRHRPVRQEQSVSHTIDTSAEAEPAGSVFVCVTVIFPFFRWKSWENLNRGFEFKGFLVRNFGSFPLFGDFLTPRLVEEKKEGKAHFPLLLEEEVKEQAKVVHQSVVEENLSIGYFCLLRVRRSR